MNNEHIYMYVSTAISVSTSMFAMFPLASRIYSSMALSTSVPVLVLLMSLDPENQTGYPTFLCSVKLKMLALPGYSPSCGHITPIECVGHLSRHYETRMAVDDSRLCTLLHSYRWL